MARRGSGLAVNPLAQLKQDDQTAERNAVDAAQAAGAVIQKLPVVEVAPDPENPESRLTPDAELTASLKAEGQVVPGMVVPVDVWAGYGNDLTTLYTTAASLAFSVSPDEVTDEQRDQVKEQIKYVINFGHRRWAAAREAGLETYNAVVSDTLKDNTTKRIYRLTENLVRKDLTPLEEAHEYARLIEEGQLSQREITRRTGIKQPHISKRRKLLNLPQDAQTALNEEVLPIEAANDLAKISDKPDRIKKVIDVIRGMPAKTDEQRMARSRAAVDLARKEYDAYKAAHDKDDARRKLTTQGVVVITNPGSYFSDKPGSRWDYQVTDEDQIAAAREAGNLVAYVVAGDHIEYYLSELPAQPEEPAVADDELEATDDGPMSSGETTDAETRHTDGAAATATGTAAKPERAPIPVPRSEPQETPEQRARREKDEKEERERKAAANARAAACARLATKAPSREALMARLSRRVLLVEEEHDWDAQQLAVKWLKAAGVVDESTTSPALFGYDTDTDIDVKLAARAAYVYDLALCEVRTSRSWDYDAEDVSHVRRLITEAAYEADDWEQQALEAAAN